MDTISSTPRLFAPKARTISSLTHLERTLPTTCTVYYLDPSSRQAIKYAEDNAKDKETSVTARSGRNGQQRSKEGFGSPLVPLSA